MRQAGPCSRKRPQLPVCINRFWACAPASGSAVLLRRSRPAEADQQGNSDETLKTIDASALLAAGLAIGAAAAQGKKWETVKIATEGAYAPWNFTGPGGKLDGFEIELANDLCARMKVKCEIVAQDWDGIIPALQAGKYDAIMAGMNITDKRLEVINFSPRLRRDAARLGRDEGFPARQAPGAGTRSTSTRTRTAAKKAIEAWKPLLKGKTVGVQVSTTNSRLPREVPQGHGHDPRVQDHRAARPRPRGRPHRRDLRRSRRHRGDRSRSRSSRT